MELFTDEQLMKLIKKGDDRALKLLINRYIKPIYHFSYRYTGNAGDAEDITQNVFVSLWKYAARFDEEKKFKTWIFAIAKNAALNWVKKKKPALFGEFEN